MFVTFDYNNNDEHDKNNANNNNSHAVSVAFSNSLSLSLTCRSSLKLGVLLSLLNSFTIFEIRTVNMTKERMQRVHFELGFIIFFILKLNVMFIY